MERSQGRKWLQTQPPLTAQVSGGHSGGVTPVPIPNTEVKPASADGTWGDSPWESRSPPDFSLEAPRMPGGLRRAWVRSAPCPRPETEIEAAGAAAHRRPLPP